MTYEELVSYCGGNERQAWCLSQVTAYTKLTEDEMEQAILCVLIGCYMQNYIGPVTQLEYVGGQRRDTLRLA